MRRVVVPLISGALVASGLVSATVASAPPATAATVGSGACQQTVDNATGISVTGPSGTTCTMTITRTGSQVTWTVPSGGLTNVGFTIKGGGNSVNKGDKGANFSGTIQTLAAGNVYMWVGQGVTTGTSTTSGGSSGGSSGANATAGAGSTDIRVGGTTAAFRKIVAGGGGGWTTYNWVDFTGGQAVGSNGGTRTTSNSGGNAACFGSDGSSAGGGGSGGGTTCDGAGGGGGGYAGGASGSSNPGVPGSSTGGGGGWGNSYVAAGFATATSGTGVSSFTGGSAGAYTGTNSSRDLLTNAGAGTIILTFTASNSSEVTAQPSNGTVGVALPTQPQVTLQQPGGIAGSGVTVTAAIASSPSPTGNQIAAVLDGTTTAITNGSGIATFSGLSIRGPTTGPYTLRFTATGYPDATSNSFELTVGAASAALTQISASPASIQVANPGNTSTITVQALDAGGNTITSGGAAVTLAASTGSIGSVTNVGNGTYTATYTGTSSIGTATISGTLNSTAITDTATVTQTVGAASTLSITTQPAAGSAYTGQVLGTQPVVRIVDVFGNPRSGDTVTVSKTSGTGTLVDTDGPLTATTDASGYATFTNLKIDSGAASSNYVLSFTSGSLTQASAAFTLAKIPTTVTWSPTNLTTNMAASPKQITPNATASVSAGGGSISYAVTSAGTTGCTVNPISGVITFATSGTCQVTASAAATPDYAASSSSAVIFEISKVAQTITFGALSNQAFGTGPYVISGSTNATGLLLTYSSTTPSVCSVVSSGSLVGGATNGSVSLLGTGTCTIQATQAGDATYDAATPVSQNFTITPGTQAALSFSSPSTATFAAPFTLQTIGGTGPGAVTYAVTTAAPANCSVNATTGALTYTAVGTCVVQATKAAGGGYASVSTSPTTITVSRAPQTTTITSAVPTNPLPGGTYAVTSTASSGLTPNLTVLAGLGTVCSITGSGASATVSFLATGTCTLVAGQAGNANYLPAAIEDTQVIEVGALNQSITFAALSNQNFGVAPFAVSASASSGLAVTFTTSTSSVCTVSSAGVVTVLTVGECRVSAAQAGNAQYAAASTVTRAFEILTVAPFAPTLTSGSAGDGSITISYVAPAFTGGASITAYQAVATPSPSGTAVTVPCADLTAPLVCTVSGLANGTAYTVTVAAINTAGVGTASGATGALTPAAAANAVTGAYAVPGNGTVTLYFEAISTGGQGGGTFTRYEIYRRVAGSSWPGTPTTTETTRGSGELSYSYSGLSNGTSYEFKIVVITTANTEEITGNTTLVTEYPSTVPTAPIGLDVFAVSGTSARVSWSFPLSDGGAPITSYTVTVSGGKSCGAVTIDSSTQVATCMITGLSYATTYTVTVVAVNRMGSGASALETYATGADPNSGGGGSGGGGNNGGGGTTGSGSGGSGNGGGGGNAGGGSDDGAGGTRSPFPAEIPTPDGPSDEESAEVLKNPSTVSVSGLPNMPLVQGAGPMPGGTTGGGSDARSGIKGVKVMPTASAELAAALAAGATVTMASGSAQVGYMTSRKIMIAPKTMLQIVTTLEPDDQDIAFRLWMQDRTGAWFRMGRTSTVNGQVVFPVMQFDTPGTYQVIATSVSGPRAVDSDGNPVFGSTTVRTIVIVTPRQALGTKICPNMIAFDPRSAMLSKKTKRQIRKLAECLGAMPAIKVSGYVAQAVRPEAAQRIAFLRARNVRNYLRELGYDGGAKLRTSIELRPAVCEETNNRCALVRLDLGAERPSERAAWQLVAMPQQGSISPEAESGLAMPVGPDVVGEQADAAPSGAAPGALRGADPPLVI